MTSSSRSDSSSENISKQTYTKKLLQRKENMQMIICEENGTGKG